MNAAQRKTLALIFEKPTHSDVRWPKIEMAESVEDYLELCAEVGKDPERPYRGEFLVRTTPDVHRAAAAAAESGGMSLNAWVEATIAGMASRRPAKRPKKKD